MKTLFMLLIICSVSLFAQNEKADDAGSLTIVISGFEAQTGKLLLRLDNSKNGYEGQGKPVRRFTPAVDSGTVIIKIDSLIFGNYTVKCYHDANNNNELDSNFMGIPTEKYGFSNNAAGLFGPPSFEDARFEFKSNGQVEKISLQ